MFLLDWNRAYTGWNISFMMGSFYLFVACSGILFAVSWFAPHVHTIESEQLVWQNPADVFRQPEWSGIGNYKFLSLALLVSVIAVYLVFH